MISVSSKAFLSVCAAGDLHHHGLNVRLLHGGGDSFGIHDGHSDVDWCVTMFCPHHCRCDWGSLYGLDSLSQVECLRHNLIMSVVTRLLELLGDGDLRLLVHRPRDIRGLGEVLWDSLLYSLSYGSCLRLHRQADAGDGGGDWYPLNAGDGHVVRNNSLLSAEHGCIEYRTLSIHVKYTV